MPWSCFKYCANAPVALTFVVIQDLPRLFSIMSERGKSFVQGAAAAQRAKTTGKSGYSALWDNKKVFFIAVFAAFGGLEYGYQQGVLGEDLVMSSFKATFPEIVSSSGATGWLTSVLQLGGWIGALSAGIFGEVGYHLIYFLNNMVLISLGFQQKAYNLLWCSLGHSRVLPCGRSS